MALQFILWQCIFFKGIQLLPAFPYQSAMHQCLHCISRLCKSSPPARMEAPWKQRLFCPSRSLLITGIQNTWRHKADAQDICWMNEWPCHASRYFKQWFGFPVCILSYAQPGSGWMNTDTLLLPLQHYHPFHLQHTLTINWYFICSSCFPPRLNLDMREDCTYPPPHWMPWA